jgi:hypothetical protein
MATKTEYPGTWNFDEDGDEVALLFEEISEAPTAGYGYKPVLIGKINDGESRTVWLFHEALVSRLREELERRPSGTFELGERILITRTDWKTSESTGRKYRDYDVSFPERPKRSAREILGITSDVDAAETDFVANETTKNNGQDSDIPF